MLPILNIGPAAIQFAGLILLVGYWLTLSMAGRRAKAAGLADDTVFNAGIFGLFAGLIGARLGYVALNWSAYESDTSSIISFTTGALYVPVGLIVGGVAAAFVLRRYRPQLPALLDALAPALALMFAFISLADVSSGSAYGTVADLPWAIELWGARRHPTQVYELIAALAALGLLFWAYRRRPYEGFLFLLFLLTIGGARLFLDAFRADVWLLPGGFRGMQVIGLVAVILSLWFMSQRAVRVSHA